MEAGTAGLRLQLCSLIPGERSGIVGGLPDHSTSTLQLPQRWPAAEDTSNVERLSLTHSRRTRLVSRNGRSDTRLSSLYKKSGVNSETIHALADEAVLLKKKAEDLTPRLNERCIYLIGMMGSGKSTVGKILSEALGYSFFDSDKLVEQAVGGTSVAQIFKQYSESFFRDNESEVLHSLSSMHRLVVATGEAPNYMKKGITVWLDVPLEALARRIAAVGTDSRPLLHHESGDPYDKALVRLRNLSRERGEVYANADVRVCLEYLATKQGLGDVSAITPTAIATEALVGMETFLKKTALLEMPRDNPP
ncbi:unnamed protein product [Spirodela intermedia]|uniref:Uncharacterized protein n=1 Tax=Spirodela intermedia TaxID=51605 RepID=A0A7I8J4G6_SPIIN|nr:unnamed protein product [Spirodela intermedia]CAA6665127.1 unnamed protein product [Spirodela intermedia]